MHTRAQREAMKAKGRTPSPQREYKTLVRKRAPRKRAFSPLDEAPLPITPLPQLNSGTITKPTSTPGRRNSRYLANKNLEKVLAKQVGRSDHTVEKNAGPSGDAEQSTNDKTAGETAEPATEPKKGKTFMNTLANMAGTLKDGAKYAYDLVGNTLASTSSNTPTLETATEVAPTVDVSAAHEAAHETGEVMDLDPIYDRVQKIHADNDRRFRRVTAAYAPTPQTTRYPRPPLQTPNLSPIPEGPEPSPPKPVQARASTQVAETADTSVKKHHTDADPRHSENTGSMLLSITPAPGAQQLAPRQFLVPQHVHDQILALVTSFEVPSPASVPTLPETPDKRPATPKDTLSIVRRNVARRAFASPPPPGIESTDLIGSCLERVGLSPEVVAALSQTDDYREAETDWRQDRKHLAHLKGKFLHSQLKAAKAKTPRKIGDLLQERE